MVQGVMMCGTFLTKKTILIIASLLFLVLILGCVSLGIGLAMFCGFTYDNIIHDSCVTSKLSLLINGGVLMGFTVIGLIVVSVLACRMNDVPTTVAPTTVTQPYTATPVSDHTLVMYPGSAVWPAQSPSQPQLPPVPAYYLAEDNQDHFQQNPMNEPQKHDPAAAQSTMQPPTSQPNM